MDSRESERIGKSSKGFLSEFVTDPITENRGCDCVAGLECFLNVIRALRMGSCFSGESGSPQSGSPVGLTKRRNSKRRFGSRSSSFDYRREELYRTPGRMFLNGSSDIACIFSQQGRKGTNQDAMIVWEVSSFSLLPDVVIYLIQ